VSFLNDLCNSVAVVGDQKRHPHRLLTEGGAQPSQKEGMEC